ncbi:hypothetical protein EV126DRAFT_223042 [Verticillium dahliae]|nr:hypothetical protein EV126DRAFT_223042 [Verticillium dahliae]
MVLLTQSKERNWFQKGPGRGRGGFSWLDYRFCMIRVQGLSVLSLLTVLQAGWLTRYSVLSCLLDRGQEPGSIAAPQRMDDAIKRWTCMARPAIMPPILRPTHTLKNAPPISEVGRVVLVAATSTTAGNLLMTGRWQFCEASVSCHILPWPNSPTLVDGNLCSAGVAIASDFALASRSLWPSVLPSSMWG